MTASDRPDVRFREEQRLRLWWAWAVSLLVAAVAWWGFVRQILLGEPFGDRPAPDAFLVAIFVLFGLGLPLLLVVIRLETEVCRDGIHLRFVPFRRRHFAPGDVDRTETVTYRPIRDYGGWGLRWSRRWGPAWTMDGNRGVRLHLAGGKAFLIGSRDPEALRAAIEEIREG